MTPQELQSVQAIQGTAGFRIISDLVHQKIKKMESVMEIDKNGLIAEQTLARQLCVELLTKFINDINLSVPANRENKKTYE